MKPRARDLARRPRVRRLLPDLATIAATLFALWVARYGFAIAGIGACESEPYDHRLCDLVTHARFYVLLAGVVLPVFIAGIVSQSMYSRRLLAVVLCVDLLVSITAVFVLPRVV